MNTDTDTDTDTTNIEKENNDHIYVQELDITNMVLHETINDDDETIFD